MAPTTRTNKASVRERARILAKSISAAKKKKSVSRTRFALEGNVNTKTQRSSGKRKEDQSTLASSSKHLARIENSEPTVEKSEGMSENLTGGLKLLKRESVTMGWLTQAIIRGKKLNIHYNEHGDPIGKEYVQLQSYIGVLARSRVSLSHKDWRQVPMDEKERIWECVKNIFVLPESKKKEVLTSAATKWRNFKSLLTSKYVMPFKDDLAALENAPDDYRFLSKDDWQKFVQSRLSNEYSTIREKQINRRKLNKYNHRLSRRGYRGMRVDMTANLSTDDVSKISRHTYWIKARQDKNGKFKDMQVEEAVQKILELERKESEGEFTAEGSKDVLTEALGNPEHSGRCRGIGAVKPVTFFKIPEKKRGRIKQSEELEALLAKERAKWEEESQKKHEEAMKKVQEEFELELHRSEKKMEERFAKWIEMRLESNVVSTSRPPLPSPTRVAKSGEGSCNRTEDDQCQKLIKFDTNKLLLNPIPDIEVDNMQGAQVEAVTLSEFPEKNMKKGKAVELPHEEDSEDLENLPTKLPQPLTRLCTWAKTALRDGRTIFTTFGPEIFGHPTKAVLFRHDMYAMVHMHEITGSTIIFYISHLCEVLKREGLDKSFLFVDPNVTYATGNKKTPTDRSKDLMDRFVMGADDSMFLLPYNSAAHWTLTVVDITNRTVYWLDPLRRRLPSGSEWTDVVNNAIKFYVACKEPKKSTKPKIRWVPLLGIPEQRDGRTCGFWIMRYMRDIVTYGNLFIEKWQNKSGLNYTQHDIDEVRKEWAAFVLRFKKD